MDPPFSERLESSVHFLRERGCAADPVALQDSLKPS